MSSQTTQQQPPCQTVAKSTFIFKTDIPKSFREHHPSGILHAFRSNTTAAPSNCSNTLPLKEEHCFAWISNCGGLLNDGTGTTAPTGGGGALDGSTLDDGAGNNVNIKNEKDDKNEYDKNNTDSKEDDNNEDGSQLMIPTIPPVNDMDVDIDKNDGSGNNDKCKDSIDTARDSTANTTRNTYLTATLSHLERFGFLPQNVKFIPFSSKANWIYKYPHAYPYIDCNEAGEVSGFPYWNPWANGMHTMAQINPALPLAGKEYNAALGVGRDAFQDNRASIEAAATTTAVAAAAYVGGDGGNGNAANNAAAAPTTPRKRGPSILKFASLSDIERNQLHLEIYNYFTWLNTELTEMETSHGGRRSVSNAGIVVSNLRGVIGKMEGAFRVIKKKDDKATAKAAAASAGGGTGTPFLEEILGPSLKQLVKQVPPHSKRGKYKKGGKEDSTRMQGKELDFDSMYAKLLEFQKEHGHVSVPFNFKADPQLGRWVSTLRRKKRDYDKKVKENGGNDIDEEDNDEEEDNSETPKKRGRRLHLTRERIDRLTAIDFEWTLQTHTISWEERMENLIEYHNENGNFRVPRSLGSLGEWVHHQRKLYNKKDKNFMSKRYARLEEIGFEFKTGRRDVKSWDDRFEQLVEFGRVKGHFDVPCPASGGNTAEDDPEMEEFRFFKWAKRQHSEYRAYSSGGESRLNYDRVKKLTEIGFEFK